MKDYVEALDELALLFKNGSLPTLQNPIPALTDLGYYLIYAGGDNTMPRIKMGKLYVAMCPFLQFTAPHVEMEDKDMYTLQRHTTTKTNGIPRTRQKKIRVAFITSYMREHSVGN